MMLGAQLFATLGNRIQPVTQPVTLDQGHGQRHDGRKGDDRDKAGDQEHLVEEDIEDAEIQNIRLLNA